MRIILVILCFLVKQAPGIDTEDHYYSGEDYSDLMDTQYIPEFSPTSDMYLFAGQSLQVNCSITDNVQWRDKLNNGSMTDNVQLFGQLNDSSDATSGVNGQSYKHNYSKSDNITIGLRAVTGLNINSLKILYCNTGSRNSCKEQNTIQLGPRTITLIKTNLTVANTGTYFCQYNSSSGTEDNLYLKIGYKPVGPVNVSCVSMNLMDLTCSWSKSQQDQNNPFPVVYSSYFHSSPQYGSFDCPHPGPLNCSIPSTGKDYVFNMFNDYTLFITSTCFCGTYTSEYKINLNEIVKLSSPIISPVNVGDREITLKMNLELNSMLSLVLIENITYQVFYKSEYSSKTISFTSSKNKNIAVTLSDLIPFTTYTISVRIRGLETKGNKYWSGTKTFDITTKPAVPDAVPALSTGGYSIYSGWIFIYLKPILHKDKNSGDARYRVTASDNSKIVSRFNVSWEETTLNATHLMRHVGYRLHIKTVNNIGESINTTTIRIPVYNTEKPVPYNIVVERSQQNYTVLWEGGNIAGREPEEVTVYWCHGNQIKHFCKSDLSWINVPLNQTNITIIGLKDKVGGDWMFAVSYQYDDGYNTGMVFAKCYFQSDAPASVSNFNVIATSQSEIHINLPEYCNNQNPRPLQYIVYYKETEANKTSCDKTFYNTTTTARLGTVEVTVHDLKPATNYSICLSIITDDGSTTSGQIHTQTMAAKTKNSMNAYIIILAVIGCGILVGVGLFIYYKIRKFCKQQIEFNLPKLNEHARDTQIYNPMVEFRPLEKGSSTDSGVSSNNQSDDISSTNSTIHNQQLHHVMYGHEQTGTIQSKNHIVISQDSTSFVNNEITSEFEEDRSNQILSSNESNQGNTTDGNCITGIQRSPSDVTTTDSIGYTNVTLRSSRVSSSIKSSITGQLSKPSNRSSMKDVFQTVPLQRQTDNISLHGENSISDKLIDNIPLHREKDSHDKREYVRDWLRKSIEDLPQFDSLNVSSTKDNTTIVSTSGIQEYVQVENTSGIQEYVQVENTSGIQEYVQVENTSGIQEYVQVENTSGIQEYVQVENTSGIQEYVQVENDGSVKSHSVDYSKYNPSDNLEKCEVIQGSSKTPNESPVQNTVVKTYMPSDTNKENKPSHTNKEEDNVHMYKVKGEIQYYDDNICRRSYKSNEKNNINDIVTVQTLSVYDNNTVPSSPVNENKENSSSNSHTISFDTSASSHTNNLVQIHKTCESQDKSERLNSQTGRTTSEYDMTSSYKMIQACVVDSKETENLSSAISDYLLVDECESHSS